MGKYINKEAIVKELEEEIAMGDEFDEKDELINKGLRIALKDIKRQQVADVQPVDRWISVKNKFPNDGERVIVCTVDEMVLEMKFDKRRECWGRLDIDGMHLFGKSFVTRWMPLPEPPKDGDTE